MHQVSQSHDSPPTKSHTMYSRMVCKDPKINFSPALILHNFYEKFQIITTITSYKIDDRNLYMNIVLSQNVWKLE